MIVKTKNDNQYYLAGKKKEVLILPALLSEIINSKGNLNSASSVRTDSDNIAYYKQKYALLKKAGYFDNPERNNNEIVTRDLLDRALANSTHIIFETTENCNLRCKYCGYSDIYSTFEKRSKNELPFDKAKTFLDFMLNKWNSSLNTSVNKRITISFYGGEPLMNFSFIQKVVDYVSTWKLKNNSIAFSMTTNGTLLDRYIDFLVKWNFTLFISIDGNRYHNSFRLYADRKESFGKVFENITLIKNKYPSYFKNSVGFNSVFHKRSSFVEVSNFFQSEFDKKPFFLALNTFGVVKEKENKFKVLYKNPIKVLNDESECNPKIKELYSSTNERLYSFMNCYDNNIFSDYSDLRFDIDNAKLPTGTCMPFQNRLYISTSGRLLPCERVGSNFVMGEILDDSVDIYYDYIMQYYNDKFKSIVSELCNKCKNIFCKSCLFTMKNDNGKIQCGKYLTEKGFNHYIASLIEECENNPSIAVNFLTSIGKF